MSTPTAMLNKMASSAGSPYNTRKRQRESTSAQISPSKRRATAANAVETAATTTTSEPAPSFERKSKSRLSRPSLPLSATPAPDPRRGPDQYELLDSPERRKENNTQPEKLMAKPKRTMRKVGQKKAQTASPFKGLGYEQLKELQSEAVLSSYDSPAKNTRTKNKNPLLALRWQNLQREGRTKHKNPLLALKSQNLQQPDDEGDLQKRTGKHRSARAGTKDEGSLVGSRPESPTNDTDEAASEELVEEIPDLEDRETGSVACHTDESGEDEPGRQSQQETDGTEQHDSSSWKGGALGQKHKPGGSEDTTGHEALGSASPRHVSRPPAEPQRGSRSSRSVGERQHMEDGEGSAPEVNYAELEQPEAEPSQRRGGRSAMSQEERQARKEAEARQRAENALETEAAEVADFEKRGQRFVRGIEDVVEELGGIEAWSKMGGGAKTITVMVENKKDMEMERCQSAWRQIRKLARWFKGPENYEENQFLATLNKLQAVATCRHLSGGGETRRGDQTIIEIFEYLIPHSVSLIRSAVKARFDAKYKHSWQEVLQLVDIAANLCNAALEWQPRPSTLQRAIRREVRTHIRPALDDVRGSLEAHLSLLEQKERTKRKAEELERAQKRAQMMRQKQWDAMEAGMSSCQLSIPQTTQPKRQRYVEAVVDIDELEDEAPNHSTGVMATQPRPRVQRQATEEIPPPDPIVTWTEQEQIALLNGLQQFRGADRYSRILETSIVLVMKDIDQCIAQVQYYKRACRHMLAKKAAEGDHSFDWLSSV